MEFIMALRGLPVHGMLDDVDFVLSAKGMFHAERFKKGDYAGPLPSDVAGHLVAYWRTVFDLSSLGPEIDVKDPHAVIGTILEGSSMMRILPIDLQTVQEYHERQVEVMRSL